MRIASFVMAAGLSSAAHAALHDRGGGLIYDDVLNVTWLQNANYAKVDLNSAGRVANIINDIGAVSGHTLISSDFDTATGKMTWWGAMAWAQDLEYRDAVRNVTLTGWQLPTVGPVNGSTFNVSELTFNGTTDRGYGITSPQSQMSYMYYVNLGNLGFCSSDGTCPRPGGGGGLWNSTPFLNIQQWYYHSGTVGAQPGAGISESDGDFQFFFYAGDQDASYKSYLEYAWAVRPGDVAAVPEPEIYAMMLVGLGLIGTLVHKRQNI